MLLRLIQFFDLLLLFLNDAVLRLIYFYNEGEQHAQQQRHQQDRQERLGVLRGHRMPDKHLRVEIGDQIAGPAGKDTDGHHRDAFPALRDQEYINQRERGDRRGAAVHAAGG